MHEEAGSIILEVLERGFRFFSVEKCNVKKTSIFHEKEEKKEKGVLKTRNDSKRVSVWFQKILFRVQNRPPYQSVILYYQRSESVLFV